MIRVPGPDWQARVWDWLEIGGRRVGIPALIVSLVAVYFAVANYRLTVAANKPELASNGMRLGRVPRPAHVAVGFENVGKKIARRGEGTLYSLDQSVAKPVKVATAPIIGAGSNVFAGYGGSAKFEVESIDPAFFLVCATYVDDAGNRYLQAILFGNGRATTHACSIHH